ncbi:dihydrodipicolinate synthase family protein [Leucobacter sp. wl10]|uniref:dihydrodipicolinate synthase family protein n=1 Tax=Leucobacter sp. wl10 TaxID=2304677 RepID=UPI000E5B7EC6|nr:dihydrodipicolinate synthase family protein [Leucobacter sp. wl10]RGE19259.1 dihydrodipicolinate synthase family protein [Leucobacter sp. wl10]
MASHVAPRGLVAPALTPFTADGDIDYGVYREQVAYLLDHGVHGISPGGSTGEGAVIEDDELGRMVAEAREIAGDRPVVAGVIRSSTKAAVRTAKVARDAGATALMVTPTFYNVLVPDDAGNESFYRAISDEVGLPTIVYNVVPQNEISPQLFTRLLDIEHIAGVKQSVGGIMAMYDMRLTAPEAKVYAATDEMLFSCFELGADGAISAVLSLLPAECRRLWDAAQAGDHQAGQALQDKIFPIWKVVRGPQFPARVKAALATLGRDLGESRSPSSPVPEVVRTALESALAPLRDLD